MPAGKALSYDFRAQLDRDHGRPGFVTRIFGCVEGWSSYAVSFRIGEDNSLNDAAGCPLVQALFVEPLVATLRTLGYDPYEPMVLVFCGIQGWGNYETDLAGGDLVLYQRFGADRTIPTRPDLIYLHAKTLLGEREELLGEDGRLSVLYDLSVIEYAALRDSIDSHFYLDPRNADLPHCPLHVFTPLEECRAWIGVYGEHYIRDLVAELIRLCPTVPPPRLLAWHGTLKCDEYGSFESRLATEEDDVLAIEFRGRHMFITGRDVSSFSGSDGPAELPWDGYTQSVVNCSRL